MCDPGTRRGRLRQLSVLVLVSLVCGVAHARHHHPPKSESVTGRFDYYLLTLSWSPTYCLVHPNDRYECTGKGYGFILHGLWPQYEGGGYPESCPTGAELTAAAAQVGRTLYPSPQLMQHEWQRHGSCSGLDAESYFRTADKAVATIRIPSMFETPRAPLILSVAQIAGEFRRANPQLSGDGFAIACSRAQLSEVRVCLTRELALRSCGKRLRSSCPVSGPVEIPSSR